MRFFQENLTKTVAQVLEKKVRLKQSATVAMIRDLAREHLQNSRTYHALVGGDLRYHFGFEKGTEQDRVDPIIDTLVSNIYHKFDGWKPTGKKFSGTWRLHLRRSAYEQILELPGSHVVNTGKAGGIIPWLDWLLNAGSDPVVSGFHIKHGDYHEKAYSRSGGAIMVPKFDWAVPSEYAGTAGDNWLTRTLGSDVFQRQIYNTAKKMFK